MTRTSRLSIEAGSCVMAYHATGETTPLTNFNQLSASEAAYFAVSIFARLTKPEQKHYMQALTEKVMAPAE